MRRSLLGSFPTRMHPTLAPKPANRVYDMQRLCYNPSTHSTPHPQQQGKREHRVSNYPLCHGGAIFGAFTRESAQLIAKYGLPGVLPYRGWLMEWLDKPQALKDLLDEYVIRLITASNGGPGQSTELIDRSKRQETVADHVAFCRDFLKVFGCTHFKSNMGRRPQNGTTTADLKAIAETGAIPAPRPRRRRCTQRKFSIRISGPAASTMRRYGRIAAAHPTSSTRRRSVPIIPDPLATLA